MIITEDRQQKIFKAIIIFSSLFALLLLLVYFFASFVTKNIDQPFQSIFWNHDVARYPQLEPLMISITQFGSFSAELAIAQSFVLILFICHRFYDIFYLVLSYAIFGGLMLVFKELIARPRPELQSFFAGEDNFIIEHSYSFPSGHSTSAMLLYGAIIIIVLNWIKNKVVKYTLSISLGIFILLIGISRIYLGVHYPTDVLAGFLLGAIGLLIMLLFIYRTVTEKLQYK